VRPAAAALALLGLCAAACETATPPVCPGEIIGTFQFSGAQLAPDGGACPIVGTALQFQAAIALVGEDQAFLCPARSDSLPMPGTRSGDHLTLANPTVPAYAPSCTCPVNVAESVEGDLIRVDGLVTGFTGEVVDVFSAADGGAGGASCEPDGGTAATAPLCGVPCQIRWRITSAR
jgi:hypothetical protein